MPSDPDKPHDLGVSTVEDLSPVATTVVPEGQRSTHETTPFESASTVAAAPASTSHPSPASPEPLLGGRYRILNELGRGAQGVVYRARDVRADMVVALKLLTADTAGVGRMARELRAARRVTHRNVVRIYDLVELPDRLGLSMEYVQGEALDRRLARTGALPAPELIALALDLARALRAAHGSGVVHRDLKPANVLLPEGGKGAKVTDFGVSRVQGQADAPAREQLPTSARLTRDGVLVGTPLYMAPEQLAGRTDIRPAADVYAFGLLVREAALGEPPPAHVSSVGELGRERASGVPTPLGALRDDLPAEFSAVIDRCLSVRPEDRFADGAQLSRALAVALLPARGLAGRRGIALLAGICALACGALLFGRARTNPKPAAPPPGHAPPPTLAMHSTPPRRITFSGCEEFPSFSPDGTRIVYSGSLGGRSRILEVGVSGGEPRVLTDTPPAHDYGPSLSPDGRTVAFLRSDGLSIDAFVVPVDGSQPPRRLTHGSVRPRWSADGRAVWAGDREHPSKFDVATGEVTETLRMPGPTLTVLEDGDARLALVTSSVGHIAQIGLLRAEGGGDARELVPRGIGQVLVLTPDARFVLLAESTPGGNDLVAMPVSGGPLTPLPGAGIHPTVGLAVSTDGRMATWSTCNDQGSLVRWNADRSMSPIVGSARSWTNFEMASVPGTRRLLALSDRDGGKRLWSLDLDGKTEDRLIATGVPGDLQDLAVAQDGRIALGAPKAGLWLASPDAAAPARRLTTDPSDAQPSFRRGGDDLVFTRTSASGTPRVFHISLAGDGVAEPLLAEGTRLPVASPVDGRVVFFTGGPDALTPHLFDPKGGSDRTLSPEVRPGRWTSATFSRDGKRLTLVGGEREMVEVEVATGKILRSAHVDSYLGPAAYVGDDLVFEQVELLGGLFVADVGFE